MHETVFDAGAKLSSNGVYRYALWRKWSHWEPLATFVMLNPSTADASIDDPTIRKCMGFARRWGAGGIWVVNLFAYRATDPRGLLSAGDPIGPHNDGWVKTAFQDIDCTPLVVAAWGACGGAANQRLLAPRVSWFRSLARDLGVPLQCLGTTRTGAPRHPLMLAYDTPLRPWEGGAQ